MISRDAAAAPVAVVTGGGTGIGAASAKALIRAGWRVVICGRRDGPLRSVAADCGASDVVCDIGMPEECTSLVNGTLERFGRLDGLVLNAGIQRLGTLATLTTQDWDDIFATNVRGPFHLAKAALPHLVETGGAVVSVASVAALRSASGMMAYGASKAALASLTQCIGVDYGPLGVRANVVCPGWTRTELADEEMAEIGSPRGLDVDESYRLVTSFVPLRRPADGDEVADVIAWLLSPAAKYVNAAMIPVDGGHAALDPGTVPFDPRVHVDAEQPYTGAE